jgi:hypothetical protein
VSASSSNSTLHRAKWRGAPAADGRDRSNAATHPAECVTTARRRTDVTMLASRPHFAGNVAFRFGRSRVYVLCLMVWDFNRLQVRLFL